MTEYRFFVFVFNHLIEVLCLQRLYVPTPVLFPQPRSLVNIKQGNMRIQVLIKNMERTLNLFNKFGLYYL